MHENYICHYYNLHSRYNNNQKYLKIRVNLCMRLRIRVIRVLKKGDNQYV